MKNAHIYSYSYHTFLILYRKYDTEFRSVPDRIRIRYFNISKSLLSNKIHEFHVIPLLLIIVMHFGRTARRVPQQIRANTDLSPQNTLALLHTQFPILYGWLTPVITWSIINVNNKSRNPVKSHDRIKHYTFPWFKRHFSIIVYIHIIAFQPYLRYCYISVVSWYQQPYQVSWSINFFIKMYKTGPPLQSFSHITQATSTLPGTCSTAKQLWHGSSIAISSLYMTFKQLSQGWFWPIMIDS